MKKSITLIALISFFIACSSGPKPIEYGEDNCHYCKMTIVDAQHAAEAVSDKGKIFKFDAIECMVHFVNERSDAEFAHLLVNDFEKPKTLINASSSKYLISKAIPSPMGAFLSAFSDQSNAESMKNKHGGEIYAWTELLQTLQK